ncbi:hypothetical protein, partial [Micromonospora psammae]|uniref:hypothetical protein n=1 Tax=Micromonospora sp. CPCC 205556 TaxID=3122398 RepID=UPI002FF2D368
MVDAELPADVTDRAAGIEYQRRGLAAELLGVLALSSHSNSLLLSRMPSQEVSGLRGSLHAVGLAEFYASITGGTLTHAGDGWACVLSPA